MADAAPNSPLSLNESFSLMSGEFGHFQTLWGAYFAVAFGVLAAVTSLKFRDPQTRQWVKVGVGVVYLWFAVLNLLALSKVRDDREQLAAYSEKLLEETKTVGKAEPQLLKVLTAKPPSEPGLVAVHLMADAIVLVLLALAPNAPGRDDHEPCRGGEPSQPSPPPA